MTEKEKAKAYDEALKKAIDAHKDDDRHLKATLERIFPELKYSDDNKMINFIINELACLRATDEKGSDRYEELTNAIGWLEKQGKEEYALKSFKDEDVRKFMQYIEKQAKAYEFNLPNRSYDIYAFAKDLLVWFEKQSKNSTDKIEPKFKVGEWVVNKFGDSWYIDSIDKKNYQVSDGKGNYNYFPISKQDEMHLWTIQDAKDGDVLVNGSNIFIFHFINNRRLMGYCHVNMDDGNFYNDIGKNECFCTIDAPVTPATKEQRDALIKAMNDAGYEWDTEKKELIKEEET